MSEHLTFSITLRPEPEGGFTVRVPALPEIVTFGESEDEALAMAKDAIELVLESRRERGEPIPASTARSCARSKLRRPHECSDGCRLSLAAPSSGLSKNPGSLS